MTYEMTARSVPRVVPDPELIPPALDLSRPELAGLMIRYQGPPSPIPRARRNALVVRRPGLPDHGIKDALTEEGWDVKTCDGPGATICPLMVGEPCALREDTDVAVVYVDKRAPSATTNAIPRLRCAAQLASPSVIAVEGSIQAPMFTDRTVMIGGLRDPKAIVDSIQRLLARVRNR